MAVRAVSCLPVALQKANRYMQDIRVILLVCQGVIFLSSELLGRGAFFFSQEFLIQWCNPEGVGFESCPYQLYLRSRTKSKGYCRSGGSEALRCRDSFEELGKCDPSQRRVIVLQVNKNACGAINLRVV